MGNWELPNATCLVSRVTGHWRP